MSFKTLKTQNNIEKLTQELERINNPVKSSFNDDRFWKPSRDEAGNGYAVIRFLPAPEVDGDDAFPWVQYWNHNFKGPTGKYYNEMSLTTLKQPDPLAAANSKLWATGKKEDQEIARKRKRTLNYVTNIYIVSDPANPENNGQVKLFRFGKKIFDKISEAMNPAFEDEKPMNPFDLWKGANFKLKIRTVADFPNYDRSEFDIPGPLFPDDDDLKAVYDQEFSLKDLISPDKFKTYEELEARLAEVLGTGTGAGNDTSSEKEEDVPSVKTTKKVERVKEEDDEDPLARFKKKVSASEFDDEIPF